METESLPLLSKKLCTLGLRRNAPLLRHNPYRAPLKRAVTLSFLCCIWSIGVEGQADGDTVFCERGRGPNLNCGSTAFACRLALHEEHWLGLVVASVVNVDVKTLG